MKIGVAYNFFDGEEILFYSIKSIRELVDYIVIIYQEISNYGNRIDNEALKLLKYLYKQKWIDDLVLYKPKEIGRGAINETQKRNFGLELCKKNNCSHYLTIDADELYDKEEFYRAANLMRNENKYHSFCTYVEYFKKPTYQIKDSRPMVKEDNKPQRTSLPFLFKITKDLKHVHGAYTHLRWFQLLTDPTRMLVPLYQNKIVYFKPSQLIMHHMSWVRKDIRPKIDNSSCRELETFRNKGEKIKSLYYNWDIGKKAPFAPQKKDIKIVENKFGVEL